jgi:uncharacterized protein (DUF488 family)
MITRQRALLRLVEREGRVISKLRLVKLSFLARAAVPGSPTSTVYEFLPYHYGPYSFTLNHELCALERDGWLRVSEHAINVSRDLRSETSKLAVALSTVLDSVVDEFRGLSTSELVSEVYRRFPWYTSLAKDHNRRQAAITLSPCAVYTVGYEGLMLDGLLDLLLRSGIRRLADVRCNPVARRFGFHKSTIERHCRDVGISYVHLPDLGIPSSWRQDLDSRGSYERLFQRYDAEILPKQEVCLQTASSMAAEIPTAFMCLEADSRCCHRTPLSKMLAMRSGLAVRELRRQ